MYVQYMGLPTNNKTFIGRNETKNWTQPTKNKQKKKKTLFGGTANLVTIKATHRRLITEANLTVN